VSRNLCGLHGEKVVGGYRAWLIVGIPANKENSYSDILTRKDDISSS
jgi:hypothetical protein